ncbi:ribosome silencing factor [Ottowia sp.]|uniref:ribosome silencing factor n=1 Tax=Ottowia sp. TaxID=1898956 RepID=UPI0025DE5A00|nr:ribosome silencing factor [Ottowia sp.]MBK6613974.1 ribosome silencing factor [Ottowia sp.]MBK6745466.1 ribosome silencing factor [Ottowia sp.]
MSETAAKKDVQKLQRAIVDGLEDVKAQDIRVFNTEHLSPLFERVIVASGTSNRQTKALASSVRDKVRDAGFAKPRMEGEENGEWIVVDCGAAVVHVMQPAIRQYYNLEEIWGDKPVRLRSAAPAERKAADSKKKASEASADTAPAATKKVAAKKTPAQPAPARKAAAGKPAVARKAAAKKAVAGKAAPRKTPARKAAAPKVMVVGKPATAKKAATARTAAAAKKAAPRTAR